MSSHVYLFSDILIKCVLFSLASCVALACVFCLASMPLRSDMSIGVPALQKAMMDWLTHVPTDGHRDIVKLLGPLGMVSKGIYTRVDLTQLSTCTTWKIYTCLCK